jgi:hypothetical protein
MAFTGDYRQLDLNTKIAQRLSGFLGPVTPWLIGLANKHGDSHVFEFTEVFAVFAGWRKPRKHGDRLEKGRVQPRDSECAQSTIANAREMHRAINR